MLKPFCGIGAVYTGGARESATGVGGCSKSTNSFPMLKLIVGAVLPVGGASLAALAFFKLASSRCLRRRGVSFVA